MTVGERIQHYRKSLGMSQDELGQKLNVSRQTISLWETGQTLPTIDNLILLKEIFSVTVDELLSDDEIKKEPLQNEELSIPLESYVVNISLDEFKRATKVNTKKFRFPMIVNIVIFVVLLVLSIIIVEESPWFFGLLTGFAFVSMIIRIKTNLSVKKVNKANENRICKTTYQYDLYDEYMILCVSNQEEEVRTQKVYYKDIEKIELSKEFCFLVISGQYWIIKRNEINENSLFNKLINETPKRKVVNSNSSKWKFLSIASIVMSILVSGFGSLFIAYLSTSSYFVAAIIFAVLFLSIPVASIVLGFYLKKTADRGRQNIIIGFITSCLFIIFSVLILVSPLLSNGGTLRLVQVESYTSIDLPVYKEYSSTSYFGTSGAKTVSKYTFDYYAAEEIENEVALSKNWLSEKPEKELKELADYVYKAENSDFYFVYNLNKAEVNTYPDEKGTYNFLNGYYFCATGELMLVEYTYTVD